jgi:peptide deformylase
MKQLVSEDHEILNQETIPFSRLAPPMDAIQLYDELIESMNHFGGVGLSANQIGYKYKVFSMNHEGQDMVVFNPEIIEESEDFIYESEGCLSYPGLYVKISRPLSLSASWENASGENFTGYFSDLSARIFLHEMDHMNGRVFYERAKIMHLQSARKKRRTNLKQIKIKSPELWQSHISNKKLRKSSAKIS